MNLKMHKINPVFSRYLIVLFLFSSLLCILFIPAYMYVFNFTLENELTYIYDRFHWGVASLDAAMNAVNNTSILTNMDSRFKIFSQDRQELIKNPVLLNELRSHFNRTLLSYPVIADAGIIFSPNIILTRQYIFYVPLLYPFYGNYLQCENLLMDEWYLFVSETNTLLPVQYYTSMSNGSYEGFTYTVQWKPRDGSDLYILYATFPVRDVLSLLIDDEILSQCVIRIYTNQNTIYNYEGVNWKLQNKYRTLTDKSQTASTFFELAIPESVISGKMVPVKHLMIGFAAVIVFFTVSLSLFFAYKWSQPMRRLLDSIDSTKIFKNEYNQNTRKTNPGLWNYFRLFYEDVSKSINVIDNKLEDSLRIIEGQTSLLREQVFYKALNQGIYTDEDEQLFRSLFTDFPGYYQLGLINYEQPDEASLLETAKVQLRLIGAVRNRIDNIYIHSFGENNIILLLPLNDRDTSWYEKLFELRSELNRQIDEALHFSLSNICEKPSDMVKAWQELQSISGAPGIEDLVSIGRINDIPDYKNRIPINIAVLQMIYNALGNGNDHTACNILTECTNDLVRERDVFIPAIISNLLHNMLLLLKMENPAILANVEIPQHIPGREDELLRKQFPECFRQIGKLVRQNKDENISQFGGKILDFINQNLYNPNLYSTMVQDHFNISQPTLQKIMKEVTGYSYLVYVETSRMNKARELLAEGACTIQEIAGKCGFSNTNSFYKAFRRIFGFPPSDIKFNQNRS